MFITTKISKFAFIKRSYFDHSILKYYFSNLKDRFAQLKANNYPNINQFYGELKNFESKLPHSQCVKFKKLIHEANKKVRKYNRLFIENQSHNQQIVIQIPYTLDGSITSSYFYHKHTQLIFYKQQIPYHKLFDVKPLIKFLSLEKIQQLVQKYTRNDMISYFFTIAPFQQQYQQVMKLIQLRYQAIQQILCKHIFAGYTQFSDQQENLFFKTQQKYKGNFKFQAIDPTSSQQNKSIVNKFSKIAKNLACLNQCRSKVQLAVEMILSQNWKDLESQTLSNLLFCTAANGKDLHSITTNIDQCSNKIINSNKSSEFFSLLFYMCISGISNHQIQQKCDKILTQASKHMNIYERLILFAMINYLSQVRQIDFIHIPKSQDKQWPKLEQSDCLKNFKKFLDEKQYKYEIIPFSDKANIISPYQMIEVQQKKFLCYSSIFYQPENQSNTLTGLSKLINEYFNSNNEKIKIINGKQLASIQKYTQKQQYLKTKMKGITKPQIKRQRKFEFYSQRQEYFEKKQGNKF